MTLFCLRQVAETSPGGEQFANNSQDVGKKYFTLTSIWLTDVDDEAMFEKIENPIEGLFEIISKGALGSIN